MQSGFQWRISRPQLSKSKMRMIGIQSARLNCLGFLLMAAFACAQTDYQTSPAFGNVVFNQPVDIVFAPGDTNRAFVIERAGSVTIIRDLTNPAREVLLDISVLVGTDSEDRGLLSLAFHPEFATNGWFYLWFSMTTDGQRYNRLARFTATDPAGPNTAVDLASQQPLISQSNGPGGHDGGQLLFGTDGYLYLSIGDGDVARDPEAAASRQRIDRGFYGTVLRIDVDNRESNLVPNSHSSVHPDTYRIPADNPFVGAEMFNGLPINPTEARTEFWAVGLRNPFRLSLDEATGQMWCADVGLLLFEEINLITRGANYGWDYREGLANGPSAPPDTITSTFIDPILQYGQDVGKSITGGFVYRGERFPALKGTYLFGDFVTGRIWALNDTGERPLTIDQATSITDLPGIVAFANDPRQDDVLLVNYFDGVISRLGVEDPTPRVVNLSGRANVGTGANVLIPSFVIAHGSKTMLIRAVGPTLGEPPINLPATLTDPKITLLNQAGDELATNDDWGTNHNALVLQKTAQRVGAFPLELTSKDAALLINLSPGIYSAISEGPGDSGVALVEFYDADESKGPGILTNSALRGHVGTGDDVMIGGLVLSGASSLQILIRAAGPSLTEYGVTNALTSPVLRIRRDGGLVYDNTVWSSAINAQEIAAASTAVGAFPFETDSADSAGLITLDPGAYTFEISGVADATGVALLEVYTVP